MKAKGTICGTVSKAARIKQNIVGEKKRLEERDQMIESLDFTDNTYFRALWHAWNPSAKSLTN